MLIFVISYLVHAVFHQAHTAPPLFVPMGHSATFYGEPGPLIADPDETLVAFFCDLDTNLACGIALIAMYDGVYQGLFKAETRVEWVAGIDPTTCA